MEIMKFVNLTTPYVLDYLNHIIIFFSQDKTIKVISFLSGLFWQYKYSNPSKTFKALLKNPLSVIYSGLLNGAIYTFCATYVASCIKDDKLKCIVPISIIMAMLYQTFKKQSNDNLIDNDSNDNDNDNGDNKSLITICINSMKYSI